MKQYISKILKSVSILYMGFPILYIPVAAVFFDVSAKTCGSVLLSLKYYVLSFAAAMVGYALWEMKRWAWYLFVIVNVLIVYENSLMAFHYGESLHPVLAFLFSVLTVLLLTYQVGREIRVPYFFPKIRWWETDPRYRLSVPVTVTRSTGALLSADIMDLSRGGCFIKLRNELGQDEEVALSFTVFNIPLKCEGVIVWRTRSTVTTPKGVGIKFTDLGRAEKRSLRVVSNRLKKVSALYRKSRHLMNQEEFLRKLEEIEAGLADKPKPSAGRAG